MANPTQNNRSRARRRGASRFAARRRLAGVFAALTVMVTGSATLLAQLDPLLFIKRVPPTIIIVMDTSLRMLEDGSGPFYDPTFYKVSDDLTVMGAFPNIDTVTTKTYRRKYSNLQYAASPGKYSADSIAAIGGGLGSGESADLQQCERRRLSGPHALQHREARRGGGRW